MWHSVRRRRRRKGYFINPLGENYLHLQPGPCPPCWQPESLPSFQSTAPLNGRWSRSSDNTVNQNSQNCAYVAHLPTRGKCFSVSGETIYGVNWSDNVDWTTRKRHLVWVQRCHGSSTVPCHFCLLLHSWAWLRDSTDFTPCTHNLHKGYNVLFFFKRLL